MKHWLLSAIIFVASGVSACDVTIPNYSGYSDIRSRISGRVFQVIRNQNSSQTNDSSKKSTYSYSGIGPKEQLGIEGARKGCRTTN